MLKIAPRSSSRPGSAQRVLVVFDATQAPCPALGHALAQAHGWPSLGVGLEDAEPWRPPATRGRAPASPLRVILVAHVDHGRVAPGLRRWLRARAHTPGDPTPECLLVVLSGGPTGLVRALDEIEILSGWTCEDVIVVTPLELRDRDIGQTLTHRLDSACNTHETVEDDTKPVGYELLTDVTPEPPRTS